MAKDVAELLSTWRQLEQREDGLPLDGADAIAIRVHTEQLRSLYGEATTIIESYDAALERARVAVADARVLLGRTVT
jgi:hypothetical protein